MLVALCCIVRRTTSVTMIRTSSLQTTLAPQFAADCHRYQTHNMTISFFFCINFHPNSTSEASFPLKYISDYKCHTSLEVYFVFLVATTKVVAEGDLGGVANSFVNGTCSAICFAGLSNNCVKEARRHKWKYVFFGIPTTTFSQRSCLLLKARRWLIQR